MALTFNLSDLSSPQLSAVTGRKVPRPYTVALASMAPYARQAAADQIAQDYNMAVLNAERAQLDQTARLNAETLAAQQQQAQIGNTIQGVGTLASAAALVGKENLLSAGGKVIEGIKEIPTLAKAASTGIKNLYTGAATPAAANATGTTAAASTDAAALTGAGIEGMEGLSAADTAYTASMMDSGVGAAWGTEGVGAASGTASTGASGFSSVALPLAAIAAAEMGRNIWGGQGIPYREKTSQQRFVDSPGTAMLFTKIPGVYAAPEGTVAGRALENMSAIERTVMAPIDYVFGSADAFNKETLNTAVNGLLNPFSDADDPSTAGQIANAIFNPIGAIGNLFCFAAGTPVTMADGRQIAVEDLDLQDDMLEGGAVTACGKALTDNLYQYRGVRVEGHHAVLDDGVWKRVQDCDRAEKVPGTFVIYPVVNTNHLIIVKDIVFSDLSETPLGWDVTEEDRLDWLNQQKRRNQKLRKRYD